MQEKVNFEKGILKRSGYKMWPETETGNPVSIFVDKSDVQEHHAGGCWCGCSCHNHLPHHSEGGDPQQQATTYIRRNGKGKQLEFEEQYR